MRTFTAIIERDTDTNLYVGYVPGFPGAHSQGETLLVQQEADLIKPDQAYPVWAPYDADEATDTMLNTLQSAKTQDHG